MKHAIGRLLGLMLALALLLSGCNLVGIDPIMQLDEDMAAMAKKMSGVVASYEGGQLTQADIMGNLVSQYSYMSQLYSMYGMSMSSDALTSIEQTVVESAVEDVAIAKQMEERGLTLTEEKETEIQSTADTTYQNYYDSFYSSAAGSTAEVKAKQTEYDLFSNGFTKETILASERAAANRELLEETVKGEITEVTDEELQSAYDSKVTADEESYSDNPGSFESAMSSDSTTVYWIPEGYRTVKHILVVPEESVLNAVTDARTAYSEAQTTLETYQDELDALNDDDAEEAEGEADETAEATEEPEATAEPRTAEEIQADIDAAQANVDSLKTAMDEAEAACIASVQDKLDEIYGKIEAGEDFDALIAEYGEDPGMQNEPTASRGYYVSSASTTWDQNFTNGAMALANVGDVTETPVISTSGVHIIRYESDATPGAVALETVKDKLAEETLETLKTEHYDAELKSWVEALKPEYHLDAIVLS